MAIVVTGATGQLGRLIVESLLDRGVEPASITATGRDVQRVSDLADRGVDTAVFDYDDPAEGVLGDGDTLMLVSSPEVGQRARQHRNVIRAAKEAGVGRIVYTSLLGVPSSDHVLADEHAETEQALADAGIPTTMLRNGWYTENFRPNFDQVAESGTFIGSAHDGRVNPAARADYADAAAAVLTSDGHEGKAYELVGSEAVTMADLAGHFGEALGRDVTYTDLDPDAHRQALVEAGLDDGVTGFLVAADANTADDLLHSTSTDLVDLIGRASTPVAESVAAWARQRSA